MRKTLLASLACASPTCPSCWPKPGQAVPAWRETAWRNAERLVAAGSAQKRAQVTREIEAHADSEALLIRSATAYGVFEDSRARDAFCAENRRG
jgi:hypothetical protein